MFREREPLLHGHSTFGGKLRHLFSRVNWRIIPGVVLMMSLLAVGVVVAFSRDESDAGAILFPTGNEVPPLAPVDVPAAADKPLLSLSPTQPQPASSSRPILKSRAPHNRSPFAPNAWDPVKLTAPDVHESEGCENGLMHFEGFGNFTNKAGIKSLKIRDLIIDAPKFSQELEGFSSLESIVIENVWVSGEFNRVVLPSLNKFIFHQFHNEVTDAYKLPQKLKSLLFFDKEAGKSWDLEKDLLNLNMTIQVTIGGTKILQIEPEFGEIVINTHYCENIVSHNEGLFSLSTLSLHWCPVSNKSVESFPSSLQFLQLNNAVPSNNSDLERIIERLTSVKEVHLFQRFHCDWPGYQIFLNISQLPPTIETVSVGNVDLSFQLEGGPSPIQNLSIDQYVTPGLAQNFDKVFQVKSLALFNVSAEDTYQILDKVLISPIVEWVLVTNLTRDFEKEGKKVETLLAQAGVPHDATCFLLEKSGEIGGLKGRSISIFESNYYRYTRLAFDKIDTYEDYVHWDANPKMKMQWDE